MKQRILKLNDIKNTNHQIVLEILLKSEGMSRTELAKKMGCDNTTISRAVRNLIARGIVIQGKKEEHGHGRPRITLELNPKGPALIGISAEPECITGVITDLRGKILERDNVFFSGKPTRDQYLSQAEGIVRRLKEIAKERFAGIGVSGFGTYIGEDFVLQNAASMPSLNGTKLQPFFNKIAGRHVTISDHLIAKMALFSHDYPEINTGSSVLISCEHGIGATFSVNGKILFSKLNHSGEFGHTVVDPNGPRCDCGRAGCLEALASSKTLLNNCQQKLKQPELTFDQLCREFQAGNAAVEEEVQKIARYLGIAVANLVTTCPVDKMFITGRLLDLGEKFQDMLNDVINAHIFPSFIDDFKIYFVRLDANTAIARGAAILAWRKENSLPPVRS